MSFEQEKKEGVRLLGGLENGTLSTADAFNIADKRDPLLVYFIFRYLREKYPPSSGASQGVIERLVALTATYSDLVKKVKLAESDPVREWFDDAYNMRQYFEKSDELVDMIVEKIEG